MLETPHLFHCFWATWVGIFLDMSKVLPNFSVSWKNGSFYNGSFMGLVQNHPLGSHINLLTGCHTYNKSISHDLMFFRFNVFQVLNCDENITIWNMNSILSIKLWWKQGIFIATGYLVSSSSFKLWCKQDVSITTHT